MISLNFFPAVTLNWLKKKKIHSLHLHSLFLCLLAKITAVIVPNLICPCPYSVLFTAIYLNTITANTSRYYFLHLPINSFLNFHHLTVLHKKERRHLVREIHPHVDVREIWLEPSLVLFRRVWIVSHCASELKVKIILVDAKYAWSYIFEHFTEVWLFYILSIWEPEGCSGILHNGK